MTPEPGLTLSLVVAAEELERDVEQLTAERDAAVKRAEEAEAERAKIEREWEVLATKDLDCEFDRMKRREAEAEVARLREALAACLRIAADSWTEPEKERHIRCVVDEALAAVSK